MRPFYRRVQRESLLGEGIGKEEQKAKPLENPDLYFSAAACCLGPRGRIRGRGWMGATLETAVFSRSRASR